MVSQTYTIKQCQNNNAKFVHVLYVFYPLLCNNVNSILCWNMDKIVYCTCILTMGGWLRGHGGAGGHGGGGDGAQVWALQDVICSNLWSFQNILSEHAITCAENKLLPGSNTASTDW